MLIQKVNCKSLLNKTNLPFDYCLNPYTGCSNSCVYCYARFMLKYTEHKEEWGSFVDVKFNAVEVLKKEVLKAKPGTVFLSSVTDSYQLVEDSYELTRSILEILPRSFKPRILTKSSLVTRDMEVFKEFEDVEVGVTITSLEDWQNFEPNASPAEERIRALKSLHKSGIRTYIFLGPVLPYITDKSLETLMQRISFVDEVMVDRLNVKSGNWPRIRKVVLEKYPRLLEQFSKAVFENNSYYSDFKKRIKKIRKDASFCF